jgi:glycosyltransferase involved in cell wall biosynthesis
MRLVVFSHKPCWPCSESPTGYATDGGFPFQMRAISELFRSTTVVVPCANVEAQGGVSHLSGHNMRIVPLTTPWGRGLTRKIAFVFWILRNGPTFFREINRADAVHAPVPGDIGTIGMLLAVLLRKPLFVRHCGNWNVQRTHAERFWRWFMERFAGGRNVMLATGGHANPPSDTNPNIGWIFSTSLQERDFKAHEPKLVNGSTAKPRLIIACRQEARKGTDKVIESLPLILKRFPNATLDVLGDGSALPALKQLASTLNVSERITFHGKVDQPTVVQLMREAALFCYPTAASEGFPKVVLEALACGLPVITTPVSVLPQLVANGCGLILEENTPEKLAAAADNVLSDRDLYLRMSHKALETARQYSLERWRDQIGTRLRSAWGEL